MPAWHWLVHIMGVDFTVPYGHWIWYNFWSGFGSMTLLTTFLATPLILYRKHNCGVRWCWRIGRHEYKDPGNGLTHMLCRRHHPAHPGRRPVTAEHILRLHREHHG